jgi:LacI family transcriptional regulator
MTDPLDPSDSTEDITVAIETEPPARRTKQTDNDADAPPPSSPARRGKSAMRHVALLIESSGSYGRGLLRGIAKYNREHGRWSTYFRPHGFGDLLPAWLEGWKGDGMLVRIDNQAMADVVSQLNVPIVNLRGTLPGLALPLVQVDNRLISQIVAQHFVERGLKHFAFVGRPRGINPVLDQRCDAFKEFTLAVTKVCHEFPAQPKVGWEQEQAQLAKWIRSLPKPVGVMACNDERGLQVLDACRRCGAAVPEQIAVAGVDNDEAMCELSIPPMTSVDVNAEGVGYEAAALLDRMMENHDVSAKPMLVAPRGVMTRLSTDMVASEDEEVNRAVRYIRENACKGLQVADVVKYVGMSRASLQQRMKQITGRTIHQEIQRVQLARVQELLVMSGLRIKQITREAGFTSVQYMTRVFRALTGETPARYRAKRVR